ncbi:MAG: molybdopterin oxidoreductase family protein, partial [Acidimicrobiia bacterium]|nr:molybdopterin oxidoreductase family protein [Acidimicrobiia bacterium]
DLGPLSPRLPEVLRTPTGRIDIAPEAIVADVESRLIPSLSKKRDGYVLVGRRDLRSNNSWMHNIKVLVKGKPRCTLHVHPDDATTLGLLDGSNAIVKSRVGEVVIPVEVTDGIMPGVVSIPHGWGHGVEGTSMSIAAANAGVNTNILTDAKQIDPLSGNAVLNGIPVTVFAA